MPGRDRMGFSFVCSVNSPSICSPETLHTMFTTQEATSFLQDQWGVERVQERFQDDGSRKGLLEEMVTLVHARVPFQSVTLMATPPADRKRPSTDVIKEECKAGIGGLCYNLNVFVWGLLRGVGFRARLCLATCTTTVTSPDTHVFVLVYDLEKKGDVHLVDCAAGFPTFRAVALDFEEESPVFVDSFLEYKFIRHEGQYLRMHGDGDKVKRNDPPVEGLDFIVGKWRRFYYFEIKPSVDLSDFDAAFDQVFTTPHITPFHHSPRALAFPDQRALIVVNSRRMVEKGGELVTTVLDGDEAIVDSYRRYFPSLPEDTVHRALDQWHSLTQH